MTSSKLFERVLQVLFAAHHFQCWATSAQEVFFQELCQHCLLRHSGHICRPDIHCSQSAPLQKVFWLLNHAGEPLQLYCMVIRRYSLQYTYRLSSIECTICRLYGPALYIICSSPELGLKPCPSNLFGTLWLGPICHDTADEHCNECIFCTEQEAAFDIRLIQRLAYTSWHLDVYYYLSASNTVLTSPRNFL